MVRVHRLSWFIHNGPIPKHLFVCHKCDNRACVNPKHLFLGTADDNVQDAVRKGRMARGETSGTHKLTEKQVLEIRKRVKNGEKQLPLAAEYGVQGPAIFKIVHRERWRHLP